jgi:flagellar motor switch protein FliG
MKESRLANRTKAAILMMVLGPELSGEIIKYLNDVDIEILGLEVARLEKVYPDVRQAVIDEFYELAVAQEFIAEGGLGNAKAVLESAFGSTRANEILNNRFLALFRKSTRKRSHLFFPTCQSPVQR